MDRIPPIDPNIPGSKTSKKQESRILRKAARKAKKIAAEIGSSSGAFAPVPSSHSKKVAPIDKQDQYGNTALMRAAESGDLEAIQKAFRAGASPNVKNRSGTTALAAAVSSAHPNSLAIVRELLNRGADPNIVDDNGMTALEIAREFCSSEIVSLLTNPSSSSSSSKAIPGILNSGDADRALSERSSSDVTAKAELMSSVQSGSSRKVDTVLTRYPHLLNMTDAQGTTPLRKAVASRQPEIVRILLNRGADTSGCVSKDPYIQSLLTAKTNSTIPIEFFEDHIRIVKKPRSTEKPLEAYDRISPFDDQKIASAGRCFKKQCLYDTRGDGNCFFNATAIGLLSSLSRVEILQKVQQYRQSSSNDYLQFDQKLKEYQNFTKDNDFELTILGLQSGLSNEDLFANDLFMSTFARVLRYMAYSDYHNNPFSLELFFDIQGDDELSNIVGKEVDLVVVRIVNSIFQIKIHGISLQDVNSPTKVIHIYGDRCSDNSNNMNQNILDLNQEPDIEAVPFVILHKGDHFLCMTS